MNAELKSKWVSALRSGRFKQGKRYLRNGDKYCCLGVLCSLVRPDETPDSPVGTWGGYQGLPGTDVPIGLKPYVARALATMNDEGASFEEIANCIEDQI